MKIAGFNAPAHVRAKLQASLYYARKERRKREADTPVFENDVLRDLFANGESGLLLSYHPGHLYADVDKTVAAAFGGGVASFDDLSGNSVTGPQSVSTARPIMGRVPRTGRRNLLPVSANFSTAYWGTWPGTAPTEVFGLDEGSSGWKHEHNGAENYERSLVRGVFTGQEQTWSVWVESPIGLDSTLIRLRDNTAGLNFASVQVGWDDLSITAAGSGVSGAVVKVSDSGPNGGPVYKISITFTGTSGNAARYFVRPNSAGYTSYSLIVHREQLETGSVATPYQRVGNEYDITEAGVPSVYYARYDSADDVLPKDATLPAITDGTVIIIGQRGIWIDEGYSFAGGNWSLGPTTYPNGPEGIIGIVGNKLDLVVIDRPLTPQERSKVVTYGVKRGSAGLIELGPELVVNGDFSAGIDGWENRTSGLEFIEPSTLTIEEGRLQIVHLPAFSPAQRATRSVTLESGAIYIIRSGGSFGSPGLSTRYQLRQALSSGQVYYQSSLLPGDIPPSAAITSPPALSATGRVSLMVFKPKGAPDEPLIAQFGHISLRRLIMPGETP